MSTRIDASGDSLSRTANLPTITGFTIMGWVYQVADRGSAVYQAIFAYGDSSGSGYYVVYWEGGVNARWGMWSGQNEYNHASLGPSTATWYGVAMVVSGTGANQFNLYVFGANGALIATLTGSGSTFPGAEKIWIGNDNDGEWGDMRVDKVKIFDAALTQDEIRRELFNAIPKRAANLNDFYPMFPGASERLRGYRNAYNWTAGGTLTDEAGSPVMWNVPFPTILTQLASGGGIVVTPGAATMKAAKVDPGLVLGSLALSPAARTMKGVGVAPTALLGSLSLTPAMRTMKGASLAPTVLLGSLSLTPAARTVRGTTLAPTVQLGSLTVSPETAALKGASLAPTIVLGSITVPPGAVTFRGLTISPTVISGGAIVIVPGVASMRAMGVDPTTVLGMLNLLPATAILRGASVAPSIVLSSLSITPAVVLVRARGAGPVVLLGALLLSPGVATGRALGFNPVTLLGSILVSPAARTMRGYVVQPTVIGGEIAEVIEINVSVTPTSLLGLIIGVNANIFDLSAGDVSVDARSVTRIDVNAQEDL